MGSLRWRSSSILVNHSATTLPLLPAHTTLHFPASFIGAIAIPLALIMLGASFARLRIPRPLSRLPLTAMFAVALAKMVVLPVIGIFIVQAMVHRGLIEGSAKAERFVAVFLSGTPAAVK